MGGLAADGAVMSRRRPRIRLTPRATSSIAGPGEAIARAPARDAPASSVAALAATSRARDGSPDFGATTDWGGRGMVMGSPARLGHRVEQCDRSDSVHHGVVQLQKQRGAPVGKASHEIGLPERSQMVEGRREDGAGEGEEPSFRGRWRQSHGAQMVIELEQGILFPAGSPRGRAGSTTRCRRRGTWLARRTIERRKAFGRGGRSRRNSPATSGLTLGGGRLGVPEECVGGQHLRGELKRVPRSSSHDPPSLSTRLVA